jgi:hypothetical protein
MGSALRDFGLDADLNLAKSLSMLNLAKSLSMWQTWRANMQYEEVAQETDACMQAAHDSCTKNLHALLGISKKLPDAQQRTRIQDSLTAAGEVVDGETILQGSNPMLLVPELFLVSSAEQHLGGMQEYVAILQRVCKVYDDILALHDAESDCLGSQGGRYARKELAIQAMQEASKAHRIARGQLKIEQLMEHDPDLAEEAGRTKEEVRNSVVEKKRKLKAAAQELQSVLATLLRMEEYFPEVCVHIRTGLPQELLAVWRPDLTIEMFEVRETLFTTANHTVYKASYEGTMYALKEFRLASNQGLKELLREAALLRKMRHPAIVEIVGIFEDEKSKAMLLQMPFFEHGTLDTWVNTEAPEWREVRRVLHDVAGALEFLHAASVVHCDVKPANILVAASCRGRLADFDISVDYATRTSKLFATTRVAYTAGYDAPELVRYVLVVAAQVLVDASIWKELPS